MICGNCQHTFTPRSVSYKCPKCKNKFTLKQRMEIARQLPPEQKCHRCGRTWQPRKHHISSCPCCGSKLWNKPLSAATNQQIDETRCRGGPWYKHYILRVRHWIGNHGAQNIVTNHIYAEYTKLA